MLLRVLWLRNLGKAQMDCSVSHGTSQVTHVNLPPGALLWLEYSRSPHLYVWCWLLTHILLHMASLFEENLTDFLAARLLGPKKRSPTCKRLIKPLLESNVSCCPIGYRKLCDQAQYHCGRGL